MKNNSDLLALLNEELSILDNSVNVLNYSYNKCLTIGIKEKYQPAELESFESLTGRFSRLSDIIIQKIFRLLDSLELESSGTIIDRLNRAEKRGLIASAETYKQIRFLRNSIAHEYVQEVIEDIFAEVLKYVPDLLYTVERIKTYAKKLI
ncbi:MAG: hypothetical protein DKM50_04890 [Candidatus Margulisiibacteriota bacterium]|nr:MAG: hypothetical protein DKM50_04890 [Candidatus Margulisiibacteriota bacterium]HCY37965.1 hypothetical protein [Candidatus Margulisiibacteriota bacterium]